jgi:hypothetical protein
LVRPTIDNPDITVATVCGGRRAGAGRAARGLTRSATGNGETVELRDITVAAQRVTWKQSVTKPMRPNLEFDVEVHGDRLTGHSRAGRPPRTAVSGVRRY